MPNIDIIMFATDNLKTYTELSVAGWKTYCEAHGYGFTLYSKPYYDDLHLAWSKIRCVLEHLKTTETEYVVLVDADTIPTSLDLSIEEIHEIFMTDKKQLLFQKDGSNRLKYLYFPHNLQIAWDKKGFLFPNAGFIIMKNNDAVIDFFKEWTDRAHTSPQADVPPRNQRVLIYEMMCRPEIKEMIGYVETWVINKYKGKLAIHFSSMNKQQVREAMAPLYIQLTQPKIEEIKLGEACKKESDYIIIKEENVILNKKDIFKALLQCVKKPEGIFTSQKTSGKYVTFSRNYINNQSPDFTKKIYSVKSITELLEG